MTSKEIEFSDGSAIDLITQIFISNSSTDDPFQGIHRRYCKRVAQTQKLINMILRFAINPKLEIYWIYGLWTILFTCMKSSLLFLEQINHLMFLIFETARVMAVCSPYLPTTACFSPKQLVLFPHDNILIPGFSP